MSATARKLLIYPFLILFLTQCASSSIVSNKGEQFRGPYHKIFILLKTDIRTVPFTTQWLKNIKAELANRNLETNSYTITSQQKKDLSLQREDAGDTINMAINAYHPEAVMIITLTNVEAYSGIQIGPPGSNGATFDVKLFNIADSKLPVWRASFKVYGQSGISMAVDNGTRKFISQLETDNLCGKLSASL